MFLSSDIRQFFLTRSSTFNANRTVTNVTRRIHELPIRDTSRSEVYSFWPAQGFCQGAVYDTRDKMAHVG